MPLHEDQGERNTDPMIGRREVCKRIGLLGSAVLLAGISSLARAMTDVERLPSGLEGQGLPRRQLGRTGVTVPILGLGGAHLLKTSDEEGTRIVHEAIDAGLTFFDNAWDYANNRSEAVMGKALKGHRHEVFLMTKMCTHGRGKMIGMLHLEQSLRRLGTDYLICGKFMKSVATMILNVSSKKRERLRRWPKRHSKGKYDSLDLPATRIRPCT